MAKYVSPDLEFVKLLPYEDILTGSSEILQESVMDPSELFE